MAAPMQNRSHGHNLASSTIPSRVILNFPLLYFTEVLLLGAIKGLKQKALTVGAVQGNARILPPILLYRERATSRQWHFPVDIGTDEFGRPVRAARIPAMLDI